MTTDNNYMTFMELLDKYSSIEIPKIQRDYVQGTKDNGKIDIIRKELLKDIKDALYNGKKLSLNFVYGKTEEYDGGKKFIPIDGQQRLTTLFLLHAYAYINDDTKNEQLQKFTYDTRKSSKDFLNSFAINRKTLSYGSDLPLSEKIKDSAWYQIGWNYDPTVTAALNMLDDIDEVFDKDPDTLAQKLEKSNDNLVFRFQNIKNIGQPDDLYIKLNSRGLPLTDFENFKSQLIGRSDEIYNKEESENFSLNLDGQWTDYFWKLGGSPKFDSKYMLFFECMIKSESIITPDLLPDDSGQNWWLKLNYNKLTKEHFDKIGYILDFLCSADENHKSIRTKLGDFLKNDNLSYYARILIYAASEFLYYSKKSEKDGDFFNWYRVFENLTQNTVIDHIDQFKKIISSINKVAHDNWENILTAIEKSANLLSNFDSEQLGEEIIKAAIIYQNNDDFTKTIYEAEEFPYFKGQLRAALYHSKDETGYNLETFKEYWAILTDFFDESSLKKDFKDDYLFRKTLIALSENETECLCEIGNAYTMCRDNNNLDSSFRNLKQLFCESDKLTQKLYDLLEGKATLEDKKNAMLECVKNSKSKFKESDWRYGFLNYPEDEFKSMSQNGMKIAKPLDDWIVANAEKGNNAKFYSVIEIAAIRELKKQYPRINTSFESNQGLYADRCAVISDRYILLCTKRGLLSLKECIRDENNSIDYSGKEIWHSETDKPIEEFCNKMKELLQT